MFGIDFSEILVIFGIALVVLGPEKLPKLANTIGRWIGRARGMARQFREQLEQETHTLHQGMDLGPEFSNRPGAHPGSGGATPRPTANSSTEERIDPRPTAASGTAPSPALTPTAMVGPPLPEMQLADTHPAGFHPYEPPLPVGSSAPVGPPAPPPAAAPASAPAPAASSAPSPALAFNAASTQAARAPSLTPPPASVPVSVPAQGAESAPEAAAPGGAPGPQAPSFPAPHETSFWPPDGVL